MQSLSYYYCAKSQIFPAAENANMGVNGKSANNAGNGAGATDDSFVNNFFPSNVFQQYDEERGQQTTTRQTTSASANGQHSNRQVNHTVA